MQCEPATIARVGQFVEPEFPANGKGHRSLYSFRNLVEIRIAEYLGKFGVPQKRIQKYIADLKQSRMGWLREDGPDGWGVLDNLGRWSVGTSIEEAVDVLNKGLQVHTAIIVNIASIKRGIRQYLQNATTDVTLPSTLNDCVE